MSDDKIQDKLEFDFQIIGTPVIWKDPKGYASLAFVRGYNVDGDRFIQPDAYWLNGKRVTDSFPLKYEGKYFVLSPQRKSESFSEKYEGKYFITYPNQLATWDVNKDGADKLIAIDRDKFFWCVDHNGRPLNGYPIITGQASDTVPGWPPQIRDVNGDGEAEILYLSDGSTRFLEIRKLDGTPLPNFPLELTEYLSSNEPLVISGNVYILYSFKRSIEGIKTSTGERLKDYPKTLETYENISPYQRMCAFESMDGIITSAEKPYLEYLNYKTGEQKRIEIKGSSSITGLATMKVKGSQGEIEYLLAYDEDNKKLFKINNKGETEDLYDIKLDKKYRNVHLSTQYDAEKNENYIFFVFYIAPKVDIDDIFKAYGTTEEEKRIGDKLYNNIADYYKVKELTGEQLKYFIERLKSYKEDYLREKIGVGKFEKLKYPAPIIDIVILKDAANKREVVFEEKFHNFVLRTNEMERALDLKPLFYSYGNKRYMIVSMNPDHRVKPKDQKSIIRIINY